MASLTICELMAYLLVVWIAKGKVEGNLAESERERERERERPHASNDNTTQTPCLFFFADAQ